MTTNVAHEATTVWFRKDGSDKFYRVWVFQGDNGQVQVVKQWGRNGAPIGQTSYTWYRYPAEARLAARDAIDAKIAKGYGQLTTMIVHAPAVPAVDSDRAALKIMGDVPNWQAGEPVDELDELLGKAPESSMTEILADIDAVLGRLELSKKGEGA